MLVVACREVRYSGLSGVDEGRWTGLELIEIGFGVRWDVLNGI